MPASSTGPCLAEARPARRRGPLEAGRLVGGRDVAGEPDGDGAGSGAVVTVRLAAAADEPGGQVGRGRNAPGHRGGAGRRDQRAAGPTGRGRDDSGGAVLADGHGVAVVAPGVGDA